MAWHLTPPSLRVSWESLVRRTTKASKDYELGLFDARLEVELEALARWVRSPSWCPDPLKVVHVPKRGIGTRRLGIPSVRDRLLQRAMLDAATSRIERRLNRHVHGFRSGRSPRSAVQDLLSQTRGQTCGDVVKTDIWEMFDSVHHRQVLATACESWDDPDWRRLVRRYLWAWPGPRGPGVGLPQGAPLSPLLANLTLGEALDHHLDFCQRTTAPPGEVPAQPGLIAWVRYADDLVLVCPGVGQGYPLLAWVDATVRRSGLALSSSKTEVLAAAAPGPIRWLGGLLHRTADGLRWRRG